MYHTVLYCTVLAVQHRTESCQVLRAQSHRLIVCHTMLSLCRTVRFYSTDTILMKKVEHQPMLQYTPLYCMCLTVPYRNVRYHYCVLQRYDTGLNRAVPGAWYGIIPYRFTPPTTALGLSPLILLPVQSGLSPPAAAASRSPGAPLAAGQSGKKEDDPYTAQIRLIATKMQQRYMPPRAPLLRLPGQHILWRVFRAALHEFDLVDITERRQSHLRRENVK